MDSNRTPLEAWEGQTYQDILDRDDQKIPEVIREHVVRDLGSEPVSVRRYTDAEFFRKEVDHVLLKSWQYACRAEEVPDVGDTYVFDLVGRSLLVTRQNDGGIRAFENICLHRGRKLATQGGCKKVLRCPYHGFTWNLDGSLLELFGTQLGDGKSWMRTTDIAVLDADNFLWINGRADNAIIRGGFKVIPDDLVRAIEQHPAVREAAVVSLPDPRLGEVPAAAYLIRSGMTAPTDDEMKAFLREKLLPYQVPVRVMAVTELPRTPSLKVSQPDLRKMFVADAK
jgi:acyl-CoA synthetase (AMP-forming)/AMP-acid ligase II